ncbi:LPS export ABC transporter permease LptF [Variovorax sp. OV329]|uniref:LPS export ABC transporter permease LptF n=1 Tax=Variovorax sp. OV329 TaxID=1882825 RepID=UPI0008E777AE|nr:LPS export ABC transporter permease LptF [Variovorax sp. OV329]SFM67283.1 lipopolysaccharide export system permease protein [Variovorax sp. OV329]
MLFQSSLRKELSRSFGATFVVLFTIVVTMMLIRTLRLAAKGSVNPSEVFLVLSYTSLGYLPTILSLCLFIAIVGTLSRMYTESEMVIWFSAGQGLGAFVRPLFQFAWPILILIAALSLVGWPWANSQTQSMRDRYQARGDIDRVAPGEFQESPGRNRVFFIDKDTADGTTANNIFISEVEKDTQIVTSAQTGRIENMDNSRYLMLRNGQRLERPLDKSELQISEFGVYGARLGANSKGGGNVAPNDRPRVRPTMDLLRDPTPANLGQFGWRVGMLLAAINFVVLALTVTSVNPRVGRSANMLFATFAFVIYYNLLNLGENWVAAGQFQPGTYLLILHGGVLVGALLWLAKRHNNWSLLKFSRPRRPETIAEAAT